MSQLYSFVYVSSATVPLTVQELEVLLASAREFNRSRQVTGMLAYNGGTFMQVLEGTETSLAAVMQRVRASRRHGDLLEMVYEPIAERAFGDWDMALRRIDADAFLRLSESRASSKIVLRSFLEEMR